MAEKTYSGDSIDVKFDFKRCIHATECVKGLPNVFDPDKKPWVSVDAASADEVAEVVRRCPSGALTYQRKDGGSEEQKPAKNVVTIGVDGCIYVSGDVELAIGDNAINNTRVALCRCGQSANKPFCDNAHIDAGFSDAGAVGKIGTKVDELSNPSEPLKVGLAQNGPLLLQGPVEIRNLDSSESVLVEKCALCRCGDSANKPFCDGAHKTNGFTAE